MRRQRGRLGAGALAAVAGLALVAAGLALLGRGLVAAALAAPQPCGYGSGCLSTGPAAAALAMLAFDAGLVALAAWQLWSQRGRGHAGLGRSAVGRPSSWPDGPPAGRPSAAWWAGLALVGLAAAAARLAWLSLAPHNWDATVLAWLAAGGLLDGQLALTGIRSTVDIPNPPASVYLVALPLALRLDQPGAPAAMVVFQALLGTATALLCALFVRRWVGSPRAALAAGLAFALGFWPLYTGRQVWPPNFLPPVVLLYVDALLLLAVGGVGRGLVWALGWLAVMVQLHYLTVFLAPLLLVAAWPGRRGLRLGHLAVGLALAALVLAPFALWEVSRDVRFRDVRVFMALGQQPAALDAASLRFGLALTGAGTAEEQVAPLQDAFVEAAAAPLRAAGAGTLLVGLGALWTLGQVVRPGRPADRVVALVLLAWVLLPLLALARHSVRLTQYYFYALLPALAILAGMGAAWPTPPRRSRRLGVGAIWAGAIGVGAIGRVPGALLLASYAAGSLLVLYAVIAFASSRHTDDYHDPLGVAGAAAEATHSAWRASGATRPIYVGARRQEGPTLHLALGAAVPAVLFDDCLELAAPSAGGGHVVYLFADRTPTLERFERLPGADLLASVPRPDGGAYRVFAVPAAALAPARHAERDWRPYPDCATRY